MSAEIVWDLPNVVRVFTVLMLWVCIAEISMVLWFYWKKIWPLRNQIEGPAPKIRVLAPPVEWTFAYHIVVGLLFISMAVSRIQALAHGDFPVTFGTYSIPVLVVAMTIVLKQFVRYYHHALTIESYRQQR